MRLPVSDGVIRQLSNYLSILVCRNRRFKATSPFFRNPFTISLATIFIMIRESGKSYKIGQFALTPLEYDKVIAACDTVTDEALIKFAVATGMRRADIVKVALSNISLSTGAVTYYEKKKRRIRTIFIGSVMRQMLVKYLNTRPKSQKLLFPFSERTCWNKLDRLCKIAQIDPRPFHALRSTCVKRCQKAGWTPEQVCELTGDSLEVIQEYYSVPSTSEMQEVTSTKEIV